MRHAYSSLHVYEDFSYVLLPIGLFLSSLLLDYTSLHLNTPPPPPPPPPPTFPSSTWPPRCSSHRTSTTLLMSKSNEQLWLLRLVNALAYCLWPTRTRTPCVAARF